MLDIGARLPAAGQHQHRLGEHLPSVMQWDPLTGDRDARRQRITKPQTVPKRSKSMQPDMSDDLLAAPFHHHRDRAVTVHLGSALLVAVLLLSTSAVSPARRASSRI